MTTFTKGEIYYFTCDERGCSTLCGYCKGHKNSNKGVERPFLILTSREWNEKNRNEGIYALPLTGGGSGNTFSVPIVEEFFENSTEFVKFRNSIILCDRICRINEKDLLKKDGQKICPKGGKIRITFCNQAKNQMLQFIKETI